jgi:hypothetical protein
MLNAMLRMTWKTFRSGWGDRAPNTLNWTMTHLDGMPSYFWLTSPRLKQTVQDDVPYTSQALREDLRRVRNAWEDCQASRDRNATLGSAAAAARLANY